MKRIHGLSAMLGVVFTLGVVAACNAWQSNNRSSSTPSSGMGVVVGDGGSSQGRQQNAQRSGTPNGRGDGHPTVNSEASTHAYMSTISLRALPREAQTVIDTIKARGTFPYRQDGQVFSNRERVLPTQGRGYYHEYTVPTPGADNRGARRVIAGSGATGDVATAGEYYYTADHYRTFSRVQE